MKLVLAVIFSLIFLVLFAMCVSMKWDYRNSDMGHEAYGLYSFTLVLTFIAAIPTFLLWYFILKERRQEE